MKKTILGFLCFLALFAGVIVQMDIGGHKGKRVVSASTGHPYDHPVCVGLRAFGDFIRERMGDKYDVAIYYSAVMGGNREAQELLQLGTLDLLQTSGSNMETFNDMYKIFGLPYLYKDEPSFRKCMDDKEFMQQIYDCTKDKGIQGVTWFANGVNNFYSWKPFNTPKDMEGLKIRVQASEANVKMIHGFKAAAVMMPYSEMYTALQNRVIDAGTNPEMALVSVKHGEVAPFYSRTEHQIFIDVLVANAAFLDSLTKEERAIFEEGFELANKVQVAEWDKQIVQCIEQAKEMGVTFVTPDKAPFEAMQAPVREALIESYPVLKPLYATVQKIQGS